MDQASNNYVHEYGLMNLAKLPQNSMLIVKGPTKPQVWTKWSIFRPQIQRNSANIKQPRPYSGLDLSHFCLESFKILENAEMVCVCAGDVITNSVRYLQRCEGQPGTRKPKSETRNPKLPKPSKPPKSPKPPKPGTLNPEPETQNPKPEAQKLKL